MYINAWLLGFLSLSYMEEIFSFHNVLFAYLFGSQVTGNIGKLSDIDIAVYFNENLSSYEKFDKKLKIIGKLSLLFERDDIDIVVLNDAYPLLEHRIIRDGKVTFSIDEKNELIMR